MKRPVNWLMSLMLVVLAFNFSAGQGQAQTAPPGNYCRFGIGVSNGMDDYDLSVLGIGSYLDWGGYRHNQIPESIRFFHVLKLSEREYAKTLQEAPNIATYYPGAIYILGNEPDSEVVYQDHLTAEQYADHYYEVAKVIRSVDPTAKFGFGTVIQPTEVRQYYLSLALDRLNYRTGGNAKAWIDVFTIHNFLLNETPIYIYDEQGKKIGIQSWGSGVPRGYQAGVWPEPAKITIEGGIDETWKTHDANLFANRIIDFRAWMKEKGMQDKPLWVTEFGSLFPSDNEGGMLMVSEQDTTDFMQQAFDFMLTAQNSTGYAADGNRLVQHFTWFSLKEPLWRYGGALYNVNTHQLTLMGERFINYDPPASAEANGLSRQPADLYVLPDSVLITPVEPGATPGSFNFRVVLRVSNQIASEYHTQAKVDISVNGGLAHQQSLNLPRCSGHSVVSFMVYNQKPGDTITLSALLTLLSGNGPETDPSDDTFTSIVTIPDVYQLFQPTIFR